MKSLPLAATFGAVLLIAGVAQAADSYKWTDDNGQVQYTQIPPKDRPYETIKTRSKQPEAAAAKAAATDAKKTDAAKEGGDVAAAKSEADKFARNCDTAKKNKEALQTIPKIRVTGEDGTERFLTDEERKEKMAATELNISTYCKQ
jgi:hypothetical protein